MLTNWYLPVLPIPGKPSQDLLSSTWTQYILFNCFSITRLDKSSMQWRKSLFYVAMSIPPVKTFVDNIESIFTASSPFTAVKFQISYITVYHGNRCLDLCLILFIFTLTYPLHPYYFLGQWTINWLLQSAFLCTHPTSFGPSRTWKWILGSSIPFPCSWTMN